MNWFKKHKKQVFRIGGTFLVLIGVGFALFWHLWLLPQACRGDGHWHEQFTKKRYWDDTQKMIRRHGWRHDDFSVVGRYGDDKWVKWIMARATEGDPIYGCGTGHKDEALNYMTNQNPAMEKDFGEKKVWLQWWSENENKTQLQWIQAGFRKYDVNVNIPSSKHDHGALLKFLGSVSMDNANESKVPGFVKYNAFRWLRDSGFDPIKYALLNKAEASGPSELIQVLTEYQKMYELYPVRDEIGILPFSKMVENDIELPRPAFFRTGFQVAGYCCMIVPIAVGMIMFVWSWKSMRNGEQEPGPAVR